MSKFTVMKLNDKQSTRHTKKERQKRPRRQPIRYIAAPTKISKKEKGKKEERPERRKCLDIISNLHATFHKARFTPRV